MSVTATGFEGRDPLDGDAARRGPMIDMTHWGYVVREPAAQGIARVLGAAASRFVGTLMLLIAAGLMLLPAGAEGAGIGEMKLGATVAFTSIGLFLFLFGRKAPRPELHVDTTRGEVRVGRRGIKGKVRFIATLKFADIASVYMLRSKERRQPARLFLRLAGMSDAIEVGCGPEDELEELRLRLTQDLARDPRQPEPVERQLQRHAHLAA